MKEIFILLFVFLSDLGFSQGQFTPVTNLSDVQSAVNNVLLGEGIVVSNITYSGGFDQMVSFSDLNGVNMSSGIVISCGYASTLFDSLPDSQFFFDMEDQQGFPGSVDFDADLEAVADTVPILIGESFNPGNARDVISLSFDFVPLSDNIHFNFIFSSDEYYGWVNSPYNDAFGFFVNGPGLDGPYSNNAVNIAVVPNTEPALPITVSSVNSALNSEYFIWNYPSTQNIKVVGYTLPLTASLNNLTPLETYHIRIALSDCTDRATNSYVLLESGSFSSTATAMGNESADLNLDGTIDVSDLILLMSDFGCLNNCVADMNGDGIVSVADIQFFIGVFETTVD